MNGVTIEHYEELDRDVSVWKISIARREQVFFSGLNDEEQQELNHIHYFFDLFSGALAELALNLRAIKRNQESYKKQ